MHAFNVIAIVIPAIFVVAALLVAFCAYYSDTDMQRGLLGALAALLVYCAIGVVAIEGVIALIRWWLK